MLTVRCGEADIAYDVDGDGDPLLLIMGFAADSRMWMLQTPAFVERFKTITFDNRGTGGSSIPGGACSLEEMAADALSILDHLEIERAHVLGISMGGAIAQHLALKAPDRVRSLVLAATWCSKNPYLRRISRVGRELYESLGDESVLRALMLFLFSPQFLINYPEFAEGIERMMLEFRVPRETFLAQMDALLEHDVKDRLGELTMPVLVLGGRRDILVPPELAEEVAKAISGAELAQLETAHAFNVEEVEQFNQLVLDFFARN